MCHDSPPSEETTFGTRNAIVLNKWAGVFPVTETNSVVVWSTSKIKNDSEDDEASNGYDFDAGEDKSRRS